MEVDSNSIRDAVYVALVVLNLVTQAVLMLGNWR